MGVVLFVTEEIHTIELEQMAHYCTHQCVDGQYYTVSRWASDQGSYAKPHATGVPNSCAKMTQDLKVS